MPSLALLVWLAALLVYASAIPGNEQSLKEASHSDGGGLGGILCDILPLLCQTPKPPPPPPPPGPVNICGASCAYILCTNVVKYRLHSLDVGDKSCSKPKPLPPIQDDCDAVIKALKAMTRTFNYFHFRWY
jgi:hypothetical protein